MLHFILLTFFILGGMCVLGFIILVGCIVYILLNERKIHKQLKEEGFFD